MPTTELAFDGQTIEPSVSVPIATVVRLAATAAGEPELEPQGLESRTYGLRDCPPRPLHPLDECVDRKFAHSLRVVLPRMTAPAARKRLAVVESCAGVVEANAKDPAVVSMLSAVSMLSLRTMGMP